MSLRELLGKRGVIGSGISAAVITAIVLKQLGKEKVKEKKGKDAFLLDRLERGSGMWSEGKGFD